MERMPQVVMSTNNPSLSGRDNFIAADFADVPEGHFVGRSFVNRELRSGRNALYMILEMGVLEILN